MHKDNIKIVLDEGISAEVVADSVFSYETENTGKEKRITTYLLEYPRFIHAELMTHRLFSRNAASSRAIPVKKKLSMIWNNPAMPVHWGVNKSGMQAAKEHSGFKRKLLRGLWRFASKVACVFAWGFMKLNLHKQIACRILEPFERYKVLVTATEFNNWFALRNHEDAQPEIQVLAKAMREGMTQSKPIVLNKGEWHTPFFGDGYWTPANVNFTLDQALKISSSCAAQTSYRILDGSLDKAEMIYGKLVESKPVHASPTEHQATPIVDEEEYKEFVTHIDVSGEPWSGNFHRWGQYRQTIDGHVVQG